MLGRLANFGLSAVLYTTFSYRPAEPCFRILIDIGKDCSWDDYRRACAWLRQNLLADLCEAGSVDGVSWSPVQPMAPPYGYRYQKPIVELNRGYGLWSLYPDELAQVEIPSSPKTGKREKIKIGSDNLLELTKANKLFVDQVGYLYKKLNFARETGSSLQYWRSNKDSNPGLYCRHDWKDIYDPSKTKWYSLQYSADDFQEAFDHKPTPRPVRVGEIRDWIASDVPYALFHENCGTGKSDALVLLSGDSPVDQRYVYTFLTIANRDAFQQKAKNAIVVKSTSEIIRELLGGNPPIFNGVQK